MATVLKRVYNGENNIIELNFTYVDDNGDEQTLDTSAVTRTILTLYGANSGADMDIDSNDLTEYFTWDDVGGLTIDIGAAGADLGDWKSSLKIYDAGHTNGQYLLHKDGENKLTVRVVT